MNRQAVEQEIQDKGLTAPRVTLADIEANITSAFYFTAAEGVYGASGHRPNSVRAGTALSLLTFCVLVLRNGFTVTGSRRAPARRISTQNWGARLPIGRLWRKSGH
jgi:hypothetical protein